MRNKTLSLQNKVSKLIDRLENGKVKEISFEEYFKAHDIPLNNEGYEYYIDAVEDQCLYLETLITYYYTMEEYIRTISKDELISYVIANYNAYKKNVDTLKEFKKEMAYLKKIK